MGVVPLECGRSSGVEHHLAKVRVGRSNRLARSNLKTRQTQNAVTIPPFGAKDLCYADVISGRIDRDIAIFAISPMSYSRKVSSFCRI